MIGGFQKQSLIDFPGKISSVVFTYGCNFRCGYCHNPELVLSKLVHESENSFESILTYLQKNKFFLDSVVITGGEPTIHVGLPLFIERIKALDLLVKLDTNGTNPDMVKNLVANKLIDYVAMDIKAPLSCNDYRRVVGSQFSEGQMEKVKETVSFLKEGNVAYEFRTTLAKPLLGGEDVKTMASELSGNYYLQPFVFGKCLSENADQYKTYEENELNEIINFIKQEGLQIKQR